MRYFLFFLLCSLPIGFLSAQGLFESAGQAAETNSDKAVRLEGYVRGSAFGAGDNYDFGTLFGETSLQLNVKAKDFIVNSDLRFRSGYRFGESFTEFELKEAYAGWATKHVDLLLGEQIVTWGRTDGINPTNNISPNHYFFLSANPDDQKMSNFMLRAKLRLGSKVDWDIIALPVYRPSIYRYDLLDLGANFVDPILPAQKIGHAALATRLNVELSGIGFSVSWFRGNDPFYGINLHNVDFSSGSPSVTYMPAFYRKNTFGFDLAVPISSWIVRAEGAYNLTENEQAKMYIPNSDLSYVLGLEHAFGPVMAILQYVGKHSLDYVKLNEPVLSDPMNPAALMQYVGEMVNYESYLVNRKIFKQQFETNHILAMTLSGNFAYDALNVEMTGLYDLSTQEYLLRPQVAWNISDALKLTAGYSYMQGPDKSLFSYASSILNGAFLELKVSF